MIGIDWTGLGELTIEAYFDACDLSFANLSQLSFKNLHLENTRCTNVDFTKSNLTESSFITTDVAGALFDEARLNHSNLIGAINEQFDPSKCEMTGATISLETAIRLAQMRGLIVDRS